MLREKCEFKGIPVPVALQFFREEMEGDWNAMLRHQLPEVPPIKSFWSDIPGFFGWLDGSVAPSSHMGIPVGPNEEVVSASSTGQIIGVAPTDLERLRFAAANRLCVDLRYQGDMKTVEPYSLRRTRGGDVVLYACEVKASACQSYRISDISVVEITRQPFVPKYANVNCCHPAANEVESYTGWVLRVLDPAIALGRSLV